MSYNVEDVLPHVPLDQLAWNYPTRASHKDGCLFQTKATWVSICCLENIHNPETLNPKPHESFAPTLDPNVETHLGFRVSG